jgi:hypothetical protein
VVDDDGEIISLNEVVTKPSDPVDENSDVDTRTAIEDDIVDVLSAVESIVLDDCESNVLLDRTTDDAVEEARLVVSKPCMPLIEYGEGLVVVKVNDDLKPELVVRIVAKELRIGEKDDAIETEPSAMLIELELTSTAFVVGIGVVIVTLEETEAMLRRGEGADETAE